MAHGSRLGVFVIDCKGDDLAQAAQFWSGLLGYEFTIDPDGKYATCDGPGAEPRLLLQHVDHDSRIHIDIETDDKAAEQKRLEGLGARLIEHHPKGWTIMEAPTGHRFCLVGPQRKDFDANANRWGNG